MINMRVAHESCDLWCVLLIEAVDQFLTEFLVIHYTCEFESSKPSADCRIDVGINLAQSHRIYEAVRDKVSDGLGNSVCRPLLEVGLCRKERSRSKKVSDDEGASASH